MADPDKRRELIKALANFCTDDTTGQGVEMLMAWDLLFKLHKKHTDWELQNSRVGREQKIKDSQS